MRIGIVINADTTTLLPFIEKEEEKKIIRENCSPNGAVAVNTLIHSFIMHGHFVRIFTVAKKQFVIKTPKLDIYATTPYNKYPVKYLWGIFKTAKNLECIIENNISDLDVLHAHWTYEYAFASSKFTNKIPVFCTVRDIASYIWKIESLKNKITWTFKVLMNNLVLHDRQIHFIANSPYTALAIKQKFNIIAPVIPNSIKDSFVNKDRHIPPKEFRILCISSSNDKRKNIKTLLYAFKDFVYKYPKSTLLLIGPPFVETNRTIQKWRKQGLLEKVNLIGRVQHDELIKYIDNCSVVANPSLEETFGNTILETIVRKVPVVGGINSGAVPYVLHNGKAGYLCDVSKPEEIFRALEHILHTPQEVQQKVEDAYKIILSEYSEDIVCKKHILVYKQL